MKCKLCGKTFSQRRGTPLFNLKTDEQTFYRTIGCLAEGNGVRETARIMDLDKDTISAWLEKASQHVEAVSRRLTVNLHLVVFGTPEELEQYLSDSKLDSKINTAFVERQNGTMRQHNRRFTRKTLAFSKEAYWVVRQMHLCVGYYHFSLPHGGLREELPEPLPTNGDGSPKKWQLVTPAMSVEVTDHVWSLKEMFTFRVLPKSNNQSNF